MTTRFNPLKDRSPGGFREFFGVAYPLVVSQLSITVMHFVDRMFLSWSSPQELAAALPAGILAFTMMSFFIGVSEFANTMVAQHHGAGREAEASRAMWQSALFAIAAGLLCYAMTPLGLFILDRSGHSETLIELEKAYFLYYWGGSLFVILNVALSTFYAGRGETRVVMYINLAGNLINIVLDYALIFGAWGFPEWGIRGAAAATFIANVFMSAAYLPMILSRSNRAARSSLSTLRLHMNDMKTLLRFGLPSGMQMMMDVGAFTVFVFLLGQLGEAELAASNIVVALNMVAFMPMFGCSIAASTLVGRHIGKDDRATAEKSAYTAWYSVEAYMIFCGLMYVMFPETLIGWFAPAESDSGAPFETIVEYGTTILLFVAVYQIADGMLLAFSGALRGAGDTFFSMWVQVCCAWLLFVPSTYMAVNWWGWGVYGAWACATVYILMVGMIYLLRFRWGAWKRIEVIEAEKELALES